MLNVRRGFVTGALATMLAGVCGSANAAPIVTFNFEDFDAAADMVAGGLTSTEFTNAGGLTQVAFGTGEAKARGWNPSSSAAESLANLDYWTFTLSADPGFAFDVTSLTLDEWREMNAPTEFQLFANGALIGSALSSSMGGTSPVISVSANDVTELVVRILAWGASNNGGSADWYLDNVIVNGTVEQVTTPTDDEPTDDGPTDDGNAVPEPSSLVLFGAGLGLVARRLRARA